MKTKLTLVKHMVNWCSMLFSLVDWNTDRWPKSCCVQDACACIKYNGLWNKRAFQSKIKPPASASEQVWICPVGEGSPSEQVWICLGVGPGVVLNWTCLNRSAVVTWDPLVGRQNDRQTWLKTLLACNFVGGIKEPISIKEAIFFVSNF